MTAFPPTIWLTAAADRDALVHRAVTALEDGGMAPVVHDEAAGHQRAPGPHIVTVDEQDASQGHADRYAAYVIRRIGGRPRDAGRAALQATMEAPAGLQEPFPTEIRHSGDLHRVMQHALEQLLTLANLTYRVDVDYRPYALWLCTGVETG